MISVEDLWSKHRKNERENAQNEVRNSVDRVSVPCHSDTIADAVGPVAGNSVTVCAGESCFVFGNYQCILTIQFTKTNKQTDGGRWKLFARLIFCCSRQVLPFINILPKQGNNETLINMINMCMLTWHSHRMMVLRCVTQESIALDTNMCMRARCTIQVCLLIMDEQHMRQTKPKHLY